MPDPPATKSVQCIKCRGDVTLQFEARPQRPEEIHNREQAWACPYCLMLNRGEFPAMLVWVTKGHAEPTSQ